jgi:hypothetical protein
MKKILLIALTLFLSSSLFPQYYIDSTELGEKKDKSWKGIIVDFGFNFIEGSDFPELKIWGSRNVNLYLYRGIYIGQSRKFSLASGFGLGLDNYNFQDESIRLASLADSFLVFNQTGVAGEKSKLSVNYIDIPLEFRFETGEKPSKKFRISLGGKVGFLFDAHTKVVYTPFPNSESVKVKIKNLYGLETFRYGLTARIGYSYLNFFGYYSLSDLFRNTRGPDATPFSMGVSFSPGYFFNF